jgi:transcriptional regulator with XRE-family HTH domain
MGKVKTNFKTKRQHFIKAWRKHRKLTLEQVAERLNVTAGALSQLERGETGYTQPMLEALADALNCEPSDLIVRDPKTTAGIMLIWDQIPEADRVQALKVLSQFKRTGTDG